ncbi:MAG: pilus assembly protein PilM, partial [Deltaproteobacteria bacterium]|nr:pilus assembly protein PilM [Deltaproteobacteria bacterium]
MKYTVLDIGTSKIGALEIEAKFKGFEILRFQEFRFPLDAKLPTAEVFVRQLKSVLENFSVHHSKLIVNMLPSDVATRFVELPFRDRKKIEQTLPFELADIVSFDVENTVTDHVVTESIGKKSNVLVCMTPRNKLISFLKIFEAHHVEPDIVQAPQVSLTSLLPYIPLPGDCFAIVDIGHSKTSVCIIDNGILKAVRVIAQGGFHLTKILSQIYEASLEESESIKLEKGYLICEKQERFNEDQTIFSDTLKKGLAPLIRDLNQTFVSMSSHNKKPIRNIYLTGGGSQLNNLPTYLTMELQIKTQLLEISSQKLPRPQSGLATTEE